MKNKESPADPDVDDEGFKVVNMKRNKIDIT